MSLTDSTTEQGLSSEEVKELLDIELFLTNGIYAYQGMLILWFTLMLGQFSKLIRSYDKIIQTGNRSKFGTLVITLPLYMSLIVNLFMSGGIVMWWAVWRCHS